MLHRSLCVLFLALLGACSTPRIDLAAWRAPSTPSPVAAISDAEEALRRVAIAREGSDLGEARKLALALHAARPEDPRVVMAASLAESDGMYLFPESDKYSRNHCAASALDYARRGMALGASQAVDHAQLAWSLGLTTHLQPMSERTDHARATITAAERALELDAKEPTALAALALVHLRLETLPWIARLMASDRPKSSLEDAERYARLAVEVRPSREHRSILSKVLDARGDDDGARGELEAALRAPPEYPRDRELVETLQARLSQL